MDNNILIMLQRQQKVKFSLINKNNNYEYSVRVDASLTIP